MRTFLLGSALLLGTMVSAVGQSIIVTGVDKLPPQFTRQAQACGVWNYTAIEKRNVPDPPTNPPAMTDQVDRGLKNIALSTTDPRTKNVRLSLVTDSYFPKDNAYKTFLFTVSLVDPTKDGYAVVLMVDWADNLTFDTLAIPATTPSTSASTLDHGLVRIDRTTQKTVTLSNTSATPMQITSIALASNASYRIVNGAVPPAVTIPVGGTHQVTVEFAPNAVADKPVTNDLVITSACATSHVALTGTVGVPRIGVDDWAVGTVEQNMQVCKDDGLRVFNNGNFDVVVSKITYSDPRFSISDPTEPALPFTVKGGEQVMLKKVCFKSASVGTASVNVTLTNDAYEGDSVSMWTANATTTGVDDDTPTSLFGARYDHAADAIVLRNVAVDDNIMVFDGRGSLLAQSTGSASRIDARSWASGLYIVARRSNGQVTTSTVVITR